jgi:uncharacterized membrane protein
MKSAKSSKPTNPAESSSAAEESLPGQRQNAELVGASENETSSISAETLEEAIVHIVREERRFSGPLPPPEILIEYNKVFPGCGKDIVEMAKREQSHRHSLEDRQLALEEYRIRSGVRHVTTGQMIGGILALALVLGSIYLLANDKSTAGLTVLGSVVVAFGGAFIYDRYLRAHAVKQSEEPEEEGSVEG